MMIYRNFATANWSDDNILNMSPEQKLIFLYLHTSQYTSACGIFKLHLRTMGFQVGLTHSPFESSLKGLCAAFPDFVAVDWTTNEVALLQYPRQLLTAANSRSLAIVAKDIENVESQYLLRELISRNSAGLSAPYKAQLNRLQIGVINANRVSALLDGNVVQVVDNEETSHERESKVKEIERESAPAQFLVTTVALETIEPAQNEYTATAPNWMDVARQMLEYSKGEGKDQYQFLCEGTKFTGDPMLIFTTWAGKASPYQLKNWKKEFSKLGTWFNTEAQRRNKPNGYQQATQAQQTQIIRDL